MSVLTTSFRTACSGWVMRRRFGQRVARCMLGCLAVESDDVLHYFDPPALEEFFAQRPDFVAS